MLAAMEAVQGKARPDDNSVVPPIDRLASLPQTMIMQMAQKGQIDKEDVLPIMNKKNENAQAAAQIKAVAQQMAQQQQMGGPPPSTVFEKVMAQNAAREAAPMTRENTGIANVPMQKQMFAGKRAGGIVAFSGRQGSYVRDFEALPEFQYTDPVFEGQPLSQFARRFARPEGVSSLLGKKKKVLPDGRAVSFGEYMKMRDAEDAKAQLAENETPNPFIGAVAETEIDPNVVEQPYEARPDSMTPAELEADMKRAGAEDRAIEKEAFAQEQLDKEAKQKELLGRPKEEIEGFGEVVASMADKTQSILDEFAIEKPEDFNPDEYTIEKTRKRFTDAGVNLNLLSDQASALAQEKLKLGKDKKEALAFFGLEAGLNILAGKDPNALVNIGAGAGKAIAPLRKELSRIKDSHNALRKEENQLARMQSQQDMGIAKFSQESLNDARKSYDAKERSYNTLRTSIANRLLADKNALKRVKITAAAQVESSGIRATAAGARASAIQRRSDQDKTIDALELMQEDAEYKAIERKIKNAETDEAKKAVRKELLDFKNARLKQLGLPPLVGSEDSLAGGGDDPLKIKELLQ